MAAAPAAPAAAEAEGCPPYTARPVGTQGVSSTPFDSTESLMGWAPGRTVSIGAWTAYGTKARNRNGLSTVRVRI